MKRLFFGLVVYILNICFGDAALGDGKDVFSKIDSLFTVEDKISKIKDIFSHRPITRFTLGNVVTSFRNFFSMNSDWEMQGSKEKKLWVFIPGISNSTYYKSEVYQYKNLRSLSTMQFFSIYEASNMSRLGRTNRKFQKLQGHLFSNIGKNKDSKQRKSRVSNVTAEFPLVCFNLKTGSTLESHSRDIRLKFRLYRKWLLNKSVKNSDLYTNINIYQQRNPLVMSIMNKIGDYKSCGYLLTFSGRVLRKNNDILSNMDSDMWSEECNHDLLLIDDLLIINRIVNTLAPSKFRQECEIHNSTLDSINNDAFEMEQNQLDEPEYNSQDWIFPKESKVSQQNGNELLSKLGNCPEISSVDDVLRPTLKDIFKFDEFRNDSFISTHLNLDHCFNNLDQYVNDFIHGITSRGSDKLIDREIGRFKGIRQSLIINDGRISQLKEIKKKEITSCLKHVSKFLSTVCKSKYSSDDIKKIESENYNNAISDMSDIIRDIHDENTEKLKKCVDLVTEYRNKKKRQEDDSANSDDESMNGRHFISLDDDISLVRDNAYPQKASEQRDESTSSDESSDNEFENTVIYQNSSLNTKLDSQQFGTANLSDEINSLDDLSPNSSESQLTQVRQDNMQKSESDTNFVRYHTLDTKNMHLTYQNDKKVKVPTFNVARDQDLPQNDEKLYKKFLNSESLSADFLKNISEIKNPNSAIPFNDIELKDSYLSAKFANGQPLLDLSNNKNAYGDEIIENFENFYAENQSIFGERHPFVRYFHKDIYLKKYMSQGTLVGLFKKYNDIPNITHFADDNKIFNSIDEAANSFNSIIDVKIPRELSPFSTMLIADTVTLDRLLSGEDFDYYPHIFKYINSMELSFLEEKLFATNLVCSRDSLRFLKEMMIYSIPNLKSLPDLHEDNGVSVNFPHILSFTMWFAFGMLINVLGTSDDDNVVKEFKSAMTGFSTGKWLRKSHKRLKVVSRYCCDLACSGDVHVFCNICKSSVYLLIDSGNKGCMTHRQKILKSLEVYSRFRILLSLRVVSKVANFMIPSIMQSLNGSSNAKIDLKNLDILSVDSTLPLASHSPSTVDMNFGNMYLGGGVFGHGDVQEESIFRNSVPLMFLAFINRPRRKGEVFISCGVLSYIWRYFKTDDGFKSKSHDIVSNPLYFNQIDKTSGIPMKCIISTDVPVSRLEQNVDLTANPDKTKYKGLREDHGFSPSATFLPALGNFDYKKKFNYHPYQFKTRHNVSYDYSGYDRNIDVRLLMQYMNTAILVIAIYYATGGAIYGLSHGLQGCGAFSYPYLLSGGMLVDSFVYILSAMKILHTRNVKYSIRNTYLINVTLVIFTLMQAKNGVDLFESLYMRLTKRNVDISKWYLSRIKASKYIINVDAPPHLQELPIDPWNNDNIIKYVNYSKRNINIYKKIEKNKVTPSNLYINNFLLYFSELCEFLAIKFPLTMRLDIKEQQESLSNDLSTV